MLKFCPKCKSIMMPKGKDLICKCGYSEKIESKVISEKPKDDKKEFIVIEKESSPNVIIDAECPKCKHMKAEYWEVQTRSADEPPTRFHKCKKCGHTWREYK